MGSGAIVRCTGHKQLIASVTLIAVDYYTALRTAYYQYRAVLLDISAPSAPNVDAIFASAD